MKINSTNSDSIKELIGEYENDENILMGDILRELLDIHSIIKGTVFKETDSVSLEIVLSSSKDDEAVKRVKHELIKNLLALDSLIASEEVIRMNPKVIKSFGPEIIMPDMVKNPLYGGKHHLTGHAFHISLNDWENLSSHYKMNPSKSATE